jgi:Calcineurin-like phosphoesterase
LSKWVISFIGMGLLLIVYGVVFFFGNSHEGKTIVTTFSSEKIKICLTGDTGMNTAIQQQIASLLNQEKCDRIIILGDIIYPDGITSVDDPQVKEKFSDYYLPLTLEDKKPQIGLVLGNHDYAANFRAWLELAQNKPWIFMPSRYFMEQISGFCFYYLDSNIFSRSRYLRDIFPQISWFREVRSSHKNICHTEVVLTHHPYFAVGRHGNAKGFLKFIYDWLFIDQSDYLISGHAHLVKDFGQTGKTRHLISGAGGQVEKGFDGGFLVMDLDLVNHSLTYSFKNESNPSGEKK